MDSVWIKLNGIFIGFCSHAAIFTQVPERPIGLGKRLLDNITLIWSFVIMLTTLCKFFKNPKQGDRFDHSNPLMLFGSISEEISQQFDWVEVAQLNYLPRINQFATIYYSLVLLAIGTSFVWRINRKFNYLIEQHNGEFDAKRELFEFFIRGPEKKSEIETETPNTCSPNKAWLINLRNVRDGASVRLRRSGLRVEPEFVKGKYHIPIGGTDFLRDQSEARWRFLAARVYIFALVIDVIAVPLTYFIWIGFGQVNVAFGPIESPANLNLISSETHLSDHWQRLTQFTAQQRVNFLLGLYAFFEQVYLISETIGIYIATNITIQLMGMDLVYKAKAIRSDLKRVRDLLHGRQLDTLPIETIQQHQLKVWAFFNQIIQFDKFVSKYSAISLINITVGVFLTKSYFLVDIMELRQATLAVLTFHAIYFTYLFLLSEHVERQSSAFKEIILAISAAERRPKARREWQRLLHGFFQVSHKRTFTINGVFPANARTFSRIVMGLLAMCLVVDKVFHKRSWDEIFSVSSLGH